MENNYTTIYVNPVERESAQGRHRQVFTHVNQATGEQIPIAGMKKTKEFGAGDTFSFPYDIANKRMITGLDMMIANPFKGSDPNEIRAEYSLDRSWEGFLEGLVQKDLIKEQHYLEIIDGRSYDFYTDKVEMSMFDIPFGMSFKDMPRPTFLQSFEITLFSEPNRFTSQTSRGRLAIKLCKVHPRIADNPREVNNAVHSWFISQEEAGLEIQHAKDKQLNEAIYRLVNILNNGGFYKAYQLATVLTNNNGTSLVKGELSQKAVEAALNNYIKDKGRYQEQYLNNFILTTNLLDTVEGAEKFEIMYMLQQAINNYVITVRDGYFIWNSQSGKPNVYKHTDKDKLINFLWNEYKVYNPDLKETNYYGELLRELRNKNVLLNDN